MIYLTLNFWTGNLSISVADNLFLRWEEINIWDVYLKFSFIYCKIASIMESKASAAVMDFILSSYLQ